jgi:hypothetical protein
MLISLAYRLIGKLLSALVTVAQRDVSEDAEVLVLRHENAVLRRHVQKVCYQPEGPALVRGALRSDPAPTVGRGFPGDPDPAG